MDWILSVRLPLLVLAGSVGLLWFVRRSFWKSKTLKEERIYTTKYKHADEHRWRSVFFGIGCLVSISSVIAAFEWVWYEKSTALVLEQPEETPYNIEPIPRTVEFSQEVPKQTVVMPPLISDIIPVENDPPVYIPMELPKTSSNDAVPDLNPTPVTSKPAPKPPVLVPPKMDDNAEDLPFKIVEDMPLFPGCDELKTKEERRACSDKALQDYIYSRIKYPAIAREVNISGTVPVSFVVERDGRITELTIMRRLGGGCDEEVLRVMQAMAQDVRWIPGKQRQVPVRVQFTMPVKFSLQ